MTRLGLRTQADKDEPYIALGHLIMEMPEQVELVHYVDRYVVDGWGDAPWIPYAKRLLAAIDRILKERKGQADGNENGTPGQ